MWKKMNVIIFVMLFIFLSIAIGASKESVKETIDLKIFTLYDYGIKYALELNYEEYISGISKSQTKIQTGSSNFYTSKKGANFYPTQILLLYASFKKYFINLTLILKHGMIFGGENFTIDRLNFENIF